MASLLLAVMPLSFAISGRLKVVPITLLFVFGLSLVITRPETRAILRQVWPVIGVCLLRLLYDIGNFLGHRLDGSTLDLPAQTLLFVLIAAVFSLPLRERTLAIGFSLTTLLLGSASLYQRYALGVDRPYGLNGGDWASVEFAMYLLVMAMLSLLQALGPDTRRPDRWLHGVAVAVGLYGAVLTQSRGPLLSFAPIFVGLMAWQTLRRGRWRQTLAPFVATLLGMLAVTATLHREMVDRLVDIPGQVREYGESAAGSTGAIGERLEMWRTAWQAFTEHPLAGVGLDQFGVYVDAHVAAGKSSTSIAKYVHPHSEYLESMAAGGVPALIVLLLFLIVPMVFFGRQLNHAQEPIARAAAAGLMVIGLYSLCAFTDNVFYRAMPQSLYLFLVLGLTVSIGRQLHLLTPRSR